MGIVPTRTKRWRSWTSSPSDYKFLPHVSRVDNVFGDRNPVCSGVEMENHAA